MGKKFWVCIIEAEFPGNTIPDGFDYVPRRAAIEAIEKFNLTSVKECWSGWGTKENRILEMMALWNKCDGDKCVIDKRIVTNCPSCREMFEIHITSPGAKFEE